jgi:CO dehydrogenase maturation factor
MEKGRPPAFAALEEPAAQVLREMYGAVDASYERRDWARYTAQMVHFHRKNAESWGNARTGADLTDQIDPGFVLGETAPAELLPGAAAPGAAAAPQPA